MDRRPLAGTRGPPSHFELDTMSKTDDMSVTDDMSTTTTRQPARTARANGKDQPGPADAPADGLTRRSRRTRRDLIVAARSLLEEQGVGALTAKAVTDRADVGYGTFYHHFESTEAVLAAGIEESMREFAAEMQRDFADADDKAWVFTASMSSTFRMLASHPALGWMLERPQVLAAALIEACGPFARRDIDAMIAAGDIEAEATSGVAYFEWILVGALVDASNSPARIREVEQRLMALVLRALGFGKDRSAALLARLAGGSKKP
jgi:AcrR family transcriptional regulator